MRRSLYSQHGIRLSHLSVMSVDFAYAGGGFRKFFELGEYKLF